LKLLTPQEKSIRVQELLKQDGNNCFFCNEELELNELVIDHLDDNPKNNTPANHVLCHQRCNLVKRTFYDYKIMAAEKLNDNLAKVIVSSIEDKSEYGNSPEIEHNINLRQFVNQQISEIILTDKEILYSDALNGLTYLAGENFGHCSQVTVRRHLDALTSSFGPFMKIKNPSGKFVITKREGN